MKAKLVYDGGEDVYIPEEMGAPREDQMQGTPAERLSELAGRVCYDSLGKGRASFTTFQREFAEPIGDGGGYTDRKIEGYHDHIRAVGHGSVLEHFNFTVAIRREGIAGDFAMSFVNRPGCFVRATSETLRVTVNLRTVQEWDRIERELEIYSPPFLKSIFEHFGNQLAPHIIDNQVSAEEYEIIDQSVEFMRFVSPETDNERWISLYLVGSRGFSHEQVRHGDFTAISQRSTRYVNESESDWVCHPLLAKYLSEVITTDSGLLASELEIAEQTAKMAYQSIVAQLEPWLISRGVDKGTARKQARGAARGCLGNALQTEMIFSASVAQWKRMIKQRASGFADAEIRQVFAADADSVLSELKRSRYGYCFDNYTLEPSPDGIGQVAVESTAAPEPAAAV
jgi:thymidylate synthase ThyX